jgi:hypothetical protein
MRATRALAVPTLLVAMLPAGTALALEPDPTIARLVDAVTREELEPVVGDLSGAWPASVEGQAITFQTRSSSSGEPIDMAERYVFEQLDSYGLDAVVYHEFPAESGAPPGRNVIGQLDGTTRPEEIVVVGAHLDDRPWSGRAPGADDNASGVSATLLLARSLAGLRFERTIRFALFGDEENAPWMCEEIGSVGYAAQCRELGEDIVAMISADAIAFDPPESDTRILEMNIRPAAQDPERGDQRIAELWLAVLEAYEIDGLDARVIATGNEWSDHGSFWKHGYPAALLVAEEQEHWNPNWHTPGDTLETLDWQLYVRASRSYLALTAHLAGISSEAVDTGAQDSAADTGARDSAADTGAKDTGSGDPPGGCRCHGGPGSRAMAAFALLAAGLAGARRGRRRAARPVNGAPPR